MWVVADILISCKKQNKRKQMLHKNQHARSGHVWFRKVMHGPFHVIWHKERERKRREIDIGIIYMIIEREILIEYLWWLSNPHIITLSFKFSYKTITWYNMNLVSKKNLLKVKTQCFNDMFFSLLTLSLLNDCWADFWGVIIVIPT